jgi:hypothetical protein
MRSRYDYRITDLLLLVTLWPLVLVKCYEYWGGVDGRLIIWCLIVSTWMCTGWYWSLKVANGLEYVSFWQRMGVTLLLWVYPVALLCLFLYGVSTVFILTRGARGIYEVSSWGDFLQYFLAPFALCVVWVWFAKKLTTRATEAWKVRDLKALEARKLEQLRVEGQL